MRERLDALQTALMTLYEEAPKDLASQIRHYELLRKQSVFEYYLRKEGYTQLGLYHIPALTVSEYHAKEAIRMGIILKSLAKSEYANEQWSLQDVSADLFDSPPRHCFKKGGYDVDVWFDHNPDNAYPYTNWTWIYYQDLDDKWHKVPGQTDYNGLFYEEIDGTKAYFLLFEKDATRFGSSGEWTVNVKNEQISLPTNSGSRRSSPGATRPTSNSNLDSEPGTSTNAEETHRGGEKSHQTKKSGSTSQPSALRRRRGEQGKQSPAKRRRGGEKTSVLSGSPSAGEVGSSHRSLPRGGLPRLRRLQEEARDPLTLLVRGPSNILKCWRYRCNCKSNSPFQYISTVWKWVTDDECGNLGRVLISFESAAQRELFVKTVKFPKYTSMSYGSLDAL